MLQRTCHRLRRVPTIAWFRRWCDWSYGHRQRTIVHRTDTPLRRQVRQPLRAATLRRRIAVRVIEAVGVHAGKKVGHGTPRTNEVRLRCALQRSGQREANLTAGGAERIRDVDGAFHFFQATRDISHYQEKVRNRRQLLSMSWTTSILCQGRCHWPA